MPIDLPPPIDLYLEIDRSGKTEALSQCFAPDATVRDERQSYQGLDAIRQWMTAAKKKYDHRVDPLELADRDGKAVLSTRLTGNFPGSPVMVDFRFAIERGKILSLEIG